MQMIAAANASIARGMPPTHSRHPSLAGLPIHGLEHTYGGMAAAMGHRGLQHGLPKLETTHINNGDFATALRTAPPMAFNTEFDFEGFMYQPGSSTINPNALHYNESPQSMALDQTSPFGPMLNDLPSNQTFDEGFDWLTGFDQQMSFQTNENVVDESSPSAISTTSQSGMSDVMLDGSNHPAPAGTSTMWQPSVMGPPQMANPFAMDLNGSVFPDLLNGAPLSPQPATQKINDPYFSTPPPSLSSLSPSVVSGLNTTNLNLSLGFTAGPETPSSLNGGNHGASPVTTITDATRMSIVNALNQCLPFGGRKYSFTSQGSPQSPQGQSGGNVNSASAQAANLPSTLDLQRYVGAYLTYFHPHLPFLHVATLSFDPAASSDGRTGGVGGSGCLILSIAAIGALYELEHSQSRELFEMAKKMIFFYLEERRKADVRKADVRRSTPGTEQHDQNYENSTHTPVWLVQAMLLNVVYGHNCGDKTASDIASTHCAALVSLAQAADLLRPIRIPSEKQDVTMTDDGNWNMRSEQDEQREWLQWRTMEERKRTLYAVFIKSSLLVLAYNHAPALTNSEIFLDLPCDEEFFAAESSAAFAAKGGAKAASHNRMTFHDALGELLRTNERQMKHVALNGGQQAFGSPMNGAELPTTDLKPSSYGCLILINALHNYIWETRQRHHNKVWTNEETEKMHRHIEPALRAWQVARANNPQCSLEQPNPFGVGPLSATAMPLLDLAYVRLFVNLSRCKEKFWQRDWDGMAEELSRGHEIVQHAERSPGSNSESNGTEPSDNSVQSGGFVESPATQTSSTDFSGSKLPTASNMSNRSISRREKHLRKAAFYAADSLAMSDKLGATFNDFPNRKLPLQVAMCAFDCAEVLAEWIATLQDRVGRYLGVLGQDGVDLSQVPAIVLLEEEDVKLLDKIQEVLSSTELKMSVELAGGGMNNLESTLQMDGHNGYASRILRVTAYMMDKAAVWPVTRLMARCLETHANHTRARAEKSVMAGGGSEP